MQATIKSAILLLLIAFFAVEVQSQFYANELKKYYVDRDLRYNWYDAWDYCVSNNMTLITIETELEQRLLRQTLGPHFDFWTSAHENANPSSNRLNRAFVWASTGRPITYADWLTNQPDNMNANEHCLCIYARDFKWNDANCYVRMNFVCQYN